MQRGWWTIGEQSIKNDTEGNGHGLIWGSLLSQFLPGQNKANDRFVGQVSRFEGRDLK
jgi:hypothetical protein